MSQNGARYRRVLLKLSGESFKGTRGFGIDHDAVSALVNLGYTKSDAYSAVLRAKDKANDNLELLIVEALKELSA